MARCAPAPVLVTVLLLVGVVHEAFAQTYIASDSARVKYATDETEAPVDTAFVRPPKTFRHTILITTTFDDENDFFLGLAYRFIVLPELDIGILAAGAARPENKYTLEEIRPHFYLQLQEYYRALLSLSVDKVQHISGVFGVYGGVGASYCFGDYSGTDRKAPTAWSAIVDVGLSVRSNGNPARFVLRAGYQYADRVTSGDNAIYLALGVGL